ncbi:hypothetical protein IAT38_006823 [Cryptococcus sp. DSM 104549]
MVSRPPPWDTRELAGVSYLRHNPGHQQGLVKRRRSLKRKQLGQREVIELASLAVSKRLVVIWGMSMRRPSRHARDAGVNKENASSSPVNDGGEHLFQITGHEKDHPMLPNKKHYPPTRKQSSSANNTLPSSFPPNSFLLNSPLSNNFPPNNSLPRLLLRPPPPVPTGMVHFPTWSLPPPQTQMAIPEVPSTHHPFHGLTPSILHPHTETPFQSLLFIQLATTLEATHSRKKRRTGQDERQIVNASLSNEMDALEILANAATDGEDILRSKGKHTARGNDTKRVSWDIEEEEKSPVRELREFPLIKHGILDENGLHVMVNTFFHYYHPTLPIFQTARIPRTRESLLDLAHNDSFLLTCIIAVASRHPPDSRYKEVHDRTWAILREAMADYSFAGLPGSVGFVEGVLLLAEHLPREKMTPPKETSVDLLAGPGTEAAGEHGMDNRRSWALIGVAIRAAYLLGLDQISLEIDESQRTPDVERARSVWTWCYLYDRTIDEFF